MFETLPFVDFDAPAVTRVCDVCYKPAMVLLRRNEQRICVNCAATPTKPLARIIRVIDRQRIECRCACGNTFTCDRDEDGAPGSECCYDCSEAPNA